MQRHVSVITHEENRLPAHFSLTCFIVLVDSYNDSVIYLNRITTGRHCAVFSKKTRIFFHTALVGFVALANFAL